MAKKYILYIDYMAGKGNACGYEYRKMEAKELGEAMQEAAPLMTENVYLMRVMVQQGKVEREGKFRNTTVKALIENRGSGWNIYSGMHLATWCEWKGYDGTVISYGEAK